MISYNDLTINERINYRSGWDVAVAYEGGNRTRFAKCQNVVLRNKNCCQEDYGLDRFKFSMRTLCESKLS